jgi:hypothetical protein
MPLEVEPPLVVETLEIETLEVETLEVKPSHTEAPPTCVPLNAAASTSCHLDLDIVSAMCPKLSSCVFHFFVAGGMVWVYDDDG